MTFLVHHMQWSPLYWNLVSLLIPLNQFLQTEFVLSETYLEFWVVLGFDRSRSKEDAGHWTQSSFCNKTEFSKSVLISFFCKLNCIAIATGLHSLSDVSSGGGSFPGDPEDTHTQAKRGWVLSVMSLNPETAGPVNYPAHLYSEAAKLSLRPRCENKGRIPWQIVGWLGKSDTLTPRIPIPKLNNILAKMQNSVWWLLMSDPVDPKVVCPKVCTFKSNTSFGNMAVRHRRGRLPMLRHEAVVRRTTTTTATRWLMAARWA